MTSCCEILRVWWSHLDGECWNNARKPSTRSWCNAASNVTAGSCTLYSEDLLQYCSKLCLHLISGVGVSASVAHSVVCCMTTQCCVGVFEWTACRSLHLKKTLKLYCTSLWKNPFSAAQLRDVCLIVKLITWLTYFASFLMSFHKAIEMLWNVARTLTASFFMSNKVHFIKNERRKWDL